MSSFPSHTVYQANAARCRALETEAADQRLAAQFQHTHGFVPQVIGSMEQRIRNLRVVVGTWLLGVERTSELTPVHEA
jgi:hypothetical protein